MRGIIKKRRRNYINKMRGIIKKRRRNYIDKMRGIIKKRREKIKIQQLNKILNFLIKK